MTRNRWSDLCTRAAAVLAGICILGCKPEIEGPITDPSRAAVDARKVLMRAVSDEDPITRAHALEALDYTVGPEAGDEYMAALSDPSPSVRSAAVMAVGESMYAPALEKLQAMADREEPDKRVYCVVIYAMYRLGDDSRMSDLHKLLTDQDEWVRASAAYIMGKTGHESALQALKNLVGDETNVNVQIRAREAMAMLGDTASAMRLEAYAMWPFIDDKIDAIRALSNLGGSRARTLLEYLTNKEDIPTLARVAAAGGLGRMNVFDQAGYDLCIRSLTQPAKVLKESGKKEQIPSDADIRALQQMAAVSLGPMGRTGAVDYLYPLLGHKDGSIRVAAAKSILQLLPSYSENVLDLADEDLYEPPAPPQAGPMAPLIIPEQSGE